MADHTKPAVMHFPQLSDAGRCAKKVRHPATRTEIPCGKGRDDVIHLFYPCRKQPCARKFWSIDTRLEHEEKSHRDR